MAFLVAWGYWEIPEAMRIAWPKDELAVVFVCAGVFIMYSVYKILNECQQPAMVPRPPGLCMCCCKKPREESEGESNQVIQLPALMVAAPRNHGSSLPPTPAAHPVISR